MSPRARALGLDQLSADERILLAEELWDSVTAEVEAGPVPQSHKDELDRRIAAHEANPKRGSPWDEVKARLQDAP